MQKQKRNQIRQLVNTEHHLEENKDTKEKKISSPINGMRSNTKF